MSCTCGTGYCEDHPPTRTNEAKPMSAKTRAFPRATGSDKDSGWTITPSLLSRIAELSRSADYPVDMEQVEVVLLALEVQSHE